MKIEGLRILVTGADGFIGSHLTEYLIRAGAGVRALTWYNARNDWGWLEGSAVRDDIEVVTGDVRDSHQCQSLTQNIDCVFHLAALIAVPFSYQAPGSYIQTNVTGTYNLLHAALVSGCSRFVHVSTSEVYGSAVKAPIDESHPIQPQSPYAASKVGADALAWSFFRSYDLPVVIARPFNTYGPRQSARAIIPTIIAQLLSGVEEVSLGNTEPTRDLMYVSDTCEGIVALGMCDTAIGKTVNLGAGTEISIGDLFEKLVQITGSSTTLSQSPDRVRPDSSEVDRLCCDASLARKLSGFAPTVDLDAGLQRTVDWFKDPANLNRYKADVYNL